jgi:hypothetical protein
MKAKVNGAWVDVKATPKVHGNEVHLLESQATGDLIYASSATQLSRLAIGSAGQRLVVSGGVPAWATDFVPGRSLQSFGLGPFQHIPGWYAHTPGSTATIIANKRYFMPIYVAWTRTYTNIVIEVTTAVTSSFIRLGIYNASVDSSGLLAPGTLRLDAGTVSGATTGIKAISINHSLSGPAYYFLAWSSAQTPAVRVLDPTLAVAPPVSGFTNGTIGDMRFVIYQATVGNGADPFENPAAAIDNVISAVHAAPMLEYS